MKFKCVVREEVSVFVTVEIEAETKEEAAKAARHAWVTNADGQMREEVDARWVEIDDEVVDTTDDDE